MIMAKVFTDKELQILAQLAYFTFSDEMTDKTLGNLFKEPDVPMTSLRLAVYELMEMKAEGKLDLNSYNEYMSEARKLLAYELERRGVSDEVSLSYAKQILSGYSILHYYSDQGTTSNSNNDSLLSLLEDELSQPISDFSEISQLKPDLHQTNTVLSLEEILNQPLIDENNQACYTDFKNILGPQDIDSVCSFDWAIIESQLGNLGISSDAIESISMFDPLRFDYEDAYDYNNSNYVELVRKIVKTRKLNELSTDQNASRYHATMDLINYIADPLGYHSESEDTNDNKEVDWEKIKDWKVIDYRSDDNGFYAVTIQAEDKMVVAFRGSESYDLKSGVLDWGVADLGLFNSILTTQQFSASEYMKFLSLKFNKNDFEWYTVGHSLGGNLAEHALLQAENMNVVLGYSFDGPGVSNEYLLLNSNKITEKSDRLVHYQYSWVGGLLNPIGGEEERKFIHIH